MQNCCLNHSVYHLSSFVLPGFCKSFCCHNLHSRQVPIAGYGIADAYNKTEIKAKLKTINDNLNTKVDAATVDSKISTAKPEFLKEAAQAASVALETRVGEIPSETTIKEYVDTAVGTGSGDMASEIAKAKEEAIKTAKEYTDSKLAIVQF